MATLRHLIILVLATALTAAAVRSLGGWLAQSAQVIASTMENKIAAKVVAGNIVVLPTGLNEALLRWRIAERIETAPDLAILGSSHSLRMGGDMAGPGRVLNLSISGSVLSDHLITTGILTRRGLAPRNWVLVVDPWLFDRQTDFGAWRIRTEELARIEDIIGRLSDPVVPPLTSPLARLPRPVARRDPNRPPPAIPALQEKIDALTDRIAGSYSIAPLVAGMDSIVNGTLRSAMTVTTTDVLAKTMLPDGSILPSADQRIVPVGTSRPLARRQFGSKGDMRRYGSFAAIDRDLWRQFENWVRFCRQDGAGVWLVLSPYHPAIHAEVMGQQNSQLAAIESRIREFAQQAGVTVVGSYDPAQPGVPEEEFQDGDHLLEDGLRRLLRPVAEARAPRAN